MTGAADFRVLELRVRRDLLRYDFRLYERIALEVVILESWGRGLSEARVSWRRVANVTGIRRAHLLDGVNTLEAAKVLAADWLNEVFVLEPDCERWRKVPRPHAGGHVMAAEDEWDLFPEPRLAVEVARLNVQEAAHVAPAATGAGSERRMSPDSGKDWPVYIAQMRQVVDGMARVDGVGVPDSGARLPDFGNRSLPESGKTAESPAKGPPPESGSTLYTLRNGIKRRDVTFKELSETGKHAVEEMARFLGQREMNRYGGWWVEAAALDADGLLEHARELLSKAATGYHFKTRGGYAWTAWQGKFQSVRSKQQSTKENV